MAPFELCSNCNRSLNKVHRYFIEKVFKQNSILNKSEIIYEYAICEPCTQNISDDISSESKNAIQSLYELHSEYLFRKLDYLHRTEKYNIESWIDRCSLTGKETRLCSEYAVSGIIEDNKLVFELSPLVVSDGFMEKLQSVLSTETKKILDDLKDQIMGDSPAVEDFIFSPTSGLI